MGTQPAYAEARHCITKIETRLKSLGEETAAKRRGSMTSSTQKPKVMKLPHLKIGGSVRKYFEVYKCSHKGCSRQ